MAGAGKRRAAREINHLNWDTEDEPEDAGTFKVAPEDILKQRVIKTARRKQIASSATEKGSETINNNIFGKFSGFAKAPAPKTTAFSFLTNLVNKADEVKVNGTSENKELPLMFKGPEDKQETGETKCSDDDEEYYGKLKGLNESVAKVIKKHVEDNPFINLEPIFKDYEKYFNEIESSRGKSKNTPENSTLSMEITKTNNDPPSIPGLSSFVFKPPSKTAENKTVTTPSIFSNEISEKKDSTPEKPQFSFGSAPNFSFTSKPTTGFTFASSSTYSKPFTFSNVAAPTETKSNETEGEKDEDDPPKVEFTPVVEKDHIYTTRCKVFVKKDGAFADRGVGNLFLKPVPNSEKVQLIVRADTNLGNLLCNFILSESIPMQRMGKKDVMLVCLPTPETQPPPMPILLRVKTPEDADKLLETLEKHKK